MNEEMVERLANEACNLIDHLSLLVHGDSDPPDKQSGERSRWYFDRQAQLGNRVIFSWREHYRWPDNPVYNPGLEHIELVTFANSTAASKFDLGMSLEWYQVHSWVEAEDWLREGVNET